MIHFGGQVLWVYSIGALTLATVFAIEFTMPVWTALLAWMFLKERLTFPRLVMLALGLAGVLVILRPGGGSFHPAALAMVLGSLCYASSFIFTKRLTSTDSALAVLFWMAVIQTADLARGGGAAVGGAGRRPTCPGSWRSASAASTRALLHDAGDEAGRRHAWRCRSTSSACR